MFPIRVRRKEDTAQLRKPETFYVSLMGLFVAAVFILFLLKQLFWLNLVSTFLALVTGALGSVTKTTEEKNGRSRITRAGGLLLAIFVLSALTAVATAYIQKDVDRKTDAQRANEILDQDRKIAALNADLREANKSLNAANDKLESQIKISLDQASLLNLLEGELQAERTPIHSVLVSWRVWVKPSSDSDCISELLSVSEEPFKKAEATRPETERHTRGTTKRFPQLLSLSESCRSEIRDWIRERSLVIHFFRTAQELKAMSRMSFARNDALRFGKGWSVRLVSTIDYPAGKFYTWNERRGVLIFSGDAELGAQDMKRPDGTTVSLYDLSGAHISFTLDHRNLLLLSDAYGIDCMTIVFNGLLPYGFGAKGTCGSSAAGFLSKEPASRSRWPQEAVYTAALPRIIR